MAARRSKRFGTPSASAPRGLFRLSRCRVERGEPAQVRGADSAPRRSPRAARRFDPEPARSTPAKRVQRGAHRQRQSWGGFPPHAAGADRGPARGRLEGRNTVSRRVSTPAPRLLRHMSPRHTGRELVRSHRSTPRLNAHPHLRSSTRTWRVRYLAGWHTRRSRCRSRPAPSQPTGGGGAAGARPRRVAWTPCATSGRFAEFWSSSAFRRFPWGSLGELQIRGAVMSGAQTPSRPPLLRGGAG